MHSCIIGLDSANIAALSLLVSLYYIQRTHHTWEALMPSLPWCDRTHTLGARLVWGECMLCVVPPSFHHHTIEGVVSFCKKWVTGKRESRETILSSSRFPNTPSHIGVIFLTTCSNLVWSRVLDGQVETMIHVYTCLSIWIMEYAHEGDEPEHLHI